MIEIIHISDFHFGSSETISSQFENRFISFITSLNNPDLIILITGDIIYKGNNSGYETAIMFINKIHSDCHIKRNNILLCPGNHDIVKMIGSGFNSFDSFSYSIRRDNHCFYSNEHVIKKTINDAIFYGINSSYNLNHEYGLVDIDKIEALIKKDKVKKSVIRIAFLHHHIINQFHNDSSALRNAYDLLILLDHYQFKYIFHGHQHSNQYLKIGESQMVIYGVKTLSNSMSGYLNGFNYYKIDFENTKILNYAYSKDKLYGNNRCDFNLIGEKII